MRRDKALDAFEAGKAAEVQELRAKTDARVAAVREEIDAFLRAKNSEIESLKGAADAAKGAADVAVDGVTKLPVGGVASGHEQCIIAGNGAPDCRVAAEALCRARGYSTGTSVDFVTSENCPPPYRVSSRDRPEGVCTMEHFVTRALCK